jgi:hypothetical protein
MNALVFEWAGMATGLLGAGLLAADTSWSWFGFALFLASNIAWIGFACQKRHWGLLLMQVGFTCTSLLGLYRWT